MIYETIKKQVADLSLLEANRGFLFEREVVLDKSNGYVVLASSNFRIKIIYERGWASIDMAPLIDDRWVEAGTVWAYLDQETVLKLPYEPLSLPNQLQRINDMYDLIAYVFNIDEKLKALERLGQQRIADFMAALRDPEQ